MCLPPTEVVSVRQSFDGPFSGEAILFLNHDGALTLSNLLAEEQLQLPRLDTPSARFCARSENMLLSACLGVFGNLLQVHIDFSVPQLQEASFPQFVASLAGASSPVEYAVVINSNFRIREDGVDQPLAIIIGITSMEGLAQAIDQWAGREATTRC
jgi:chemotaxis protein CheC